MHASSTQIISASSSKCHSTTNSRDSSSPCPFRCCISSSFDRSARCCSRLLAVAAAFAAGAADVDGPLGRLVRRLLWFVLLLLLPLLRRALALLPLLVGPRLPPPPLPDFRRCLPPLLVPSLPPAPAVLLRPLPPPPPPPPYTLTMLSADGPGGRLDRRSAVAADGAGRCCC